MIDTKKVYKLQNVAIDGYLDTYNGDDKAEGYGWHYGGRVQIGKHNI